MKTFDMMYDMMVNGKQNMPIYVILEPKPYDYQILNTIQLRVQLPVRN